MNIPSLRNSGLPDHELLERALFALARAREDAERLREMRDDAEEAMLRTIEGREYLALKKDHSEAEKAAREFKATAAELAVELFDGSNKDVAPGASIAIYANFVLHEESAVKWAVDNGHSILLRPDVQGFKQLLDRLPEDIYEIEEEPRARISRKNLSELYPHEPAPEDEVSVTEAPEPTAVLADIPF